MNKRNILSIILAILSAGLAILAYIILPEQVVIQFSIGSSGNATAPKLLAVLIPAAIGIGGAVLSMFPDKDEAAFVKSIIVSVVGIGISVFMIAVNFAM